MSNRKKKIKKLISSLCAMGAVSSSLPSNEVSGSYVHWCSKDVAEGAADEFQGFLEKGVVPYLNDKTALNIDLDRRWTWDDIEEQNELSKDIQKKMNDLLISMNWKSFVDATIDKYKQGEGVLTEARSKAIEALRDALKYIGKTGEFEPYFAGLAENKSCSLTDLVVKRACADRASDYIDKWAGEIKRQLLFQLSGWTKAGIGAGVIAGGTWGIVLARGAVHDYNQRKLARMAIEHKEKFQKKEDTVAKLFAEKVDIAPEKIDVEKLRNMLETEALDWPYAPDEIALFMDTYIGILIAKQENPLAKCPPIILLGKPGCGKSEWLKRVIRCTFECIDRKNDQKDKSPSLDWKDRCIFINQDRIDEKSSISARDQISGTHEEKREDVSVTCYSDSAAANKFGKGIHLKYIDEIEKLPVDVILSIWDTADSGGRAIALATGNGNPADYVQGNGADFKEAFEDRAIIIELPAPSKDYIRSCIKKLIAEINEKNPGKAPVVITNENLDTLVDVCTSNRSVATMKSPILGLQLKATKEKRSNTPIKVNPKKPRPERIIIDESYENPSAVT